MASRSLAPIGIWGREREREREREKWVGRGVLGVLHCPTALLLSQQNSLLQ